MKAYNLEDQIFGKAMMEKVLKSDISDSSALVNRLTDSRFKEFHKAMPRLGLEVSKDAIDALFNSMNNENMMFADNTSWEPTTACGQTRVGHLMWGGYASKRIAGPMLFAQLTDEIRASSGNQLRLTVPAGTQLL